VRSPPTFTLFAVASVAVHLGVAAAVVRVRASAAKAPPAHDPPAALAGDTFEIASAGDDGREIDLDQETPAAPGAATVAAPGPRASVGAKTRRRAKPEPTAPGDPGAATTELYGAVGERSAVDLATAFTRGFPQAASADPVWATVPFGAAGDATVSLTIDESGHLTHDAVAGSATSALRSGIARTLALLRARAFTAHGATTRLLVSAHVAPDQVHDGLHGDVFALGGSFTGGQGNAFFALNIGRRVDVTIRAR
jgi:hypothetical protein